MTDPKRKAAVAPRLERRVGRPCPKRAALLAQITAAQREVRAWPEWMMARVAMPHWMLEWDDT
jgi:hypothetical protein